MLSVTCDYCNKQLSELGGLLFDAPNAGGMARKYHACKKCFATLTPKPAGALASIDDVIKLGLKTARVSAAERVEGSEKLLKLTLEDGGEGRTILAGIGKVYTPEVMVGKTIVIVGNLAPRAMMGHTSQGMLLAASAEEGPVLIMPESSVDAGASVG